ncbi:MAG: hypothetical protein FWC27_09795 [Firmicutes bacterium]|nr:hypothetical protein [Bacillota bacterium]
MKKLLATTLAILILIGALAVSSSALDGDCACEAEPCPCTAACEFDGVNCTCDPLPTPACECCDRCVTAQEEGRACYCKCDADTCSCTDISWAKQNLPDWMSWMYWVSRWDITEWIFHYLAFGWLFELISA